MTRDPRQPNRDEGLLGWLEEMARSHDGLALLLPHTIKLMALLPRMIETARTVIEESGAEAALDGAANRMQPLADAALTEASALVRGALERDELVVEAIDAFTHAFDRAAEDPRVAALMSSVADRSAQAIDRGLALVLDHTLENKPDPGIASAGVVLGSIAQRFLERSLDLALPPRNGADDSGDNSAG